MANGKARRNRGKESRDKNPGSLIRRCYGQPQDPWARSLGRSFPVVLVSGMPRFESNAPCANTNTVSNMTCMHPYTPGFVMLDRLLDCLLSVSVGGHMSCHGMAWGASCKQDRYRTRVRGGAR